MEMIWFPTVARLYFVREQSIHVWNDFDRHIHKALAKNKANVRSCIGSQDSPGCVA